MELNHLKRFYEVAKAGGFTRAARQVRAQQPALSRAVAQLEHDLGVTLLERGKRSVALTKAGADVFAVCEEIFERLATIEQIADAARNEYQGALRYGATSELSADVLPQVTATLFRRFPKIWPMAFVGPASAMLDRVVSAELDFALFYHVPKPRPELAVRPIASVPFDLVVARDRRRDAAVLATFIGSREIDDSATRLYPTLARHQRDVRDARIRMSSNDASTRRELARAGLGVTILPHHMVEEDLRARRLMALYPKERFRFDLLLVTRRQRAPSKASETFLDALRAALGE